MDNKTDGAEMIVTDELKTIRDRFGSETRTFPDIMIYICVTSSLLKRLDVKINTKESFYQFKQK